jgi:predicted amidohydrolase
MDVRKLAEGIGDKTFNWMRNMASEYNISLIGSFICSDTNKHINRLIWMNPTGEFHTYDKRHLFRMGEEHKYFYPGNSRLVVNYRNWRICPLICYDLRFPVWSRNKEDYDLLIYVANWPAVRSQAWNILARARAIENQCYVVAVNRTGKDGKGIKYSGESLVIDPKGYAIKKGLKNKPGIINCAIGLDELKEIRQKFPVFEDADDFTIID